MSADLAIVGARIRTLDPRRPFATAVAIEDGVIVAVDDVAEHCDARTEVIDAQGRALIPGLVDSHIHPFWGAELARGIDLSSCRTPDAVLGALQDADGWTFAWGLDYDAAPTPEAMAAALAAPVFIRYSDMHTAFASPRALEAAGIAGPRDFEDGSEVVCLDGRPTGELREMSAQALVLAAAPQLTGAERRDAHVATLRRLNALGLTGAHVMDGTPETFDLLRELEAAGELTVRLRVPLLQTPATTVEEMHAQLALRDERGELWSGGVAKFFADGVIDSGTAWLSEPDSHDAGTAPFWPEPQRLADAIALFAGAGFQCATHAIGDAAARFVLDAYVRAGGLRRHRLEHLETLPDDMIGAMARAGVIASMQPIHLQYTHGNWAERLGPERAARAFRTRDLLDAGVLLALGSDWPIAGADPLAGMAAAVHRTGVTPGQALTPLEALHGYTTAPARVAGELGGRIAPGLPADITGLDEDPVDARPEEVWLTIVGGRTVYNRSASVSLVA